MLLKKECIQAIKAWEHVGENYLKIKSLINPKSVFSFNRTGCDWLNKYNKNDYFHTYVGILDNNLILIVVPIDKSGKEVNLPSYLISPLLPLTKDLNLIEKVVIKKIKKITLTKDLQVESRCEEIQLPFENEPSIRENLSVSEIQLWKNQCLDWFYYECNKYKGKRIFKTFIVPFADLVKNNQDVTEVHCLFGFNESTVYKKQVPALIFVAVDGIKQQAEIIRSNNNMLYSNTGDFASPCPPFCREEDSFILLK